MNLFPDIQELVSGVIQDQIKVAHDKESAARVVAVLNQWLALTRKKNVPGLDQRMIDFRKRIGVLAAVVELACLDGHIVVKASGDAETTLRLLRRGTDWFDPAEDVDKLIAGAILSE